MIKAKLLLLSCIFCKLYVYRDVYVMHTRKVVFLSKNTPNIKDKSLKIVDIFPHMFCLRVC